MPLEIRELLIKTSISNESEEAKVSSKTNDGTGSNSDAIVAACVEQVLAILKEKQER